MAPYSYTQTSSPDCPHGEKMVSVTKHMATMLAHGPCHPTATRSRPAPLINRFINDVAPKGLASQIRNVWKLCFRIGMSFHKDRGMFHNLKFFSLTPGWGSKFVKVHSKWSSQTVSTPYCHKVQGPRFDSWPSNLGRLFVQQSSV